MSRFREIVRKLPVFPAVYLYFLRKYQQRKRNTGQIFTEIYQNNLWRGTDSVSGTGSDIQQTRIIIEELPILFKDFDIHTMLDIPCGDFNWMKTVDLTGINYVGADIVKELVEKNLAKYGDDGTQFFQLDLIKSALPKVDLIFCRDCLVHLSNNDIFGALENMCKSESTYVLTTVFPERLNNDDIETGEWRVLNLEHAPFFLPAPLKVINEGCLEYEGTFPDKSLGLWLIADIRESLKRRAVS